MPTQTNLAAAPASSGRRRQQKLSGTGQGKEGCVPGAGEDADAAKTLSLSANRSEKDICRVELGSS